MALHPAGEMVEDTHEQPKSIYLAGKIAEGDWRHEETAGGISYEDGDDLRSIWQQHYAYPEPKKNKWRWPVLYKAVHGLNYVGPFFMSCDHGCAHGSSSHGAGKDDRFEGMAYPAPTRKEMLKLCFTAIKNCDIFFVWLDIDVKDADHVYSTAYGTLVELGYARALGKTIIVASPTYKVVPSATLEGGPEVQGCPCGTRPEYWEDGVDSGRGCKCGRDDLWFALEAADQVITADTPRDALAQLSVQWLRDAQEALLESPLERSFWHAVQKTDHPELSGIVPQHWVVAGGKNYRLDFAIPEKKIAFEMDGRTYHNTPEAFKRDSERDRALELIGWRVHRWDGDTIRENPAKVVREAVRLTRLC